MSNLSKFQVLEAFLAENLNPFNFHLLACANLEVNTRMLSEETPKMQSVVLIGNVGSSFWPQFSASPEFADGLAEPLDRYSERLISSVANKVENAKAVFPSDGPPYAPFQRWAMKSGSYHQSPVAVLIHPEFGLWTAFRGAILLPFQLSGLENLRLASPCASCTDKPCLTTCPVNAFSPPETGEGFGSYDVEACRSEVATKEECYQTGCLARGACPIAPELSYTRDQVKFHMNKFISG